MKMPVTPANELNARQKLLASAWENEMSKVHGKVQLVEMESIAPYLFRVLFRKQDGTEFTATMSSSAY